MLGFESSLHRVCPYKGLQLLVQRQRGLVCAFAWMRVCVCTGTTEHWLQCEVSIVCCLSCHVSDLISWILTSPRLNPPDVSDGAPHLCFHGNAIIPHANWALIRAAIMGWRGGMCVSVYVCVHFWEGDGVSITLQTTKGSNFDTEDLSLSFSISSSPHPALWLPSHLHW